MTLGDIVDAAIRLYRMHWRALMGFVAILVVPLQFVDEYLRRNYQHVNYGTTAGQAQLGRAFAIGLVVSLFGLLIVQPLINGGSAFAVGSFHLGRTPNAGDVLEGALPFLGSVLLVIVLYTLVVLGGLILVILPGVYFLVRFHFGVPAVVLEKERGRDALRRSWRLTQGAFWRLFGILLVTGILAGIVAAVFAVPAALAADHSGTSGWVIRAVGGSVGGVLTTPFTQTVVMLLYFDLRVRKEGLTLDRLQWEVGSP
jgi:hypothetical protein